MKELIFKFTMQDLNSDERDQLKPKRQSDLASGFDLASAHKESLSIAPMSRVLVSTGISIALEAGFEAQVRSRSGLTLKHGIIVLNSPGTIDADYRGEIKVILANMSPEPFVVSFGMRIAQLVIAKVTLCSITEHDALSASLRGEAGFGSTGI